MMNLSEISSNLLFHFTKQLDTVLSILENGFYPRTSKENMSVVLSAYNEVKIGVPMVCFTDIPLNLSSEHRAAYGCYGIGLSKEWAKRSKISPVFYMIKGSGSWEIYNHMQAVIKEMILHKSNHSPQEVKDKVVISLIELAGYIKPYSEDGREKPFYDEREWRYVPPLSDIPYHCNRLLPEMLDNNTEQEKLNRKMEEKYALKFSEADVEKIIIPKCEGLGTVIKRLYTVKRLDPEALIRKIQQV